MKVGTAYSSAKQTLRRGAGVMWDKHLWNTQRGTLWWKCIIFKRDGRPARWSITEHYPVSEWTCQHWYVKMSMDVRSQTFLSTLTFTITHILWILLILTDRMKCWSLYAQVSYLRFGSFHAEMWPSQLCACPQIVLSSLIFKCKYH